MRGIGRIGMLGLMSLAAGASLLGPEVIRVPTVTKRPYDPRVSYGGGRGRKGNSLAHHGLNGPRAVARRLRQIEAGSLRVQNGLVA